MSLKLKASMAYLTKHFKTHHDNSMYAWDPVLLAIEI